MTHRGLITLLTGLLLTGSGAFAQSSGGEQTGIRTVGAVGITERVSDIMTRAREDDARGPRAPRIKYEFENEYRRPQQAEGASATASCSPCAGSSPT